MRTHSNRGLGFLAILSVVVVWSGCSLAYPIVTHDLLTTSELIMTGLNESSVPQVVIRAHIDSRSESASRRTLFPLVTRCWIENLSIYNLTTDETIFRPFFVDTMSTEDRLRRRESGLTVQLQGVEARPEYTYDIRFPEARGINFVGQFDIVITFDDFALGMFSEYDRLQVEYWVGVSTSVFVDQELVQSRTDGVRIFAVPPEA